MVEGDGSGCLNGETTSGMKFPAQLGEGGRSWWRLWGCAIGLWRCIATGLVPDLNVLAYSAMLVSPGKSDDEFCQVPRHL